jgi:hypothetical protein
MRALVARTRLAIPRGVRFTTLTVLALGGCNATYAPPIRGYMYGAPARLTEGRVEVGGTAGGLVTPNIGGPHVAVGIRDWVALEAGGNLQLLGGGDDRWAMGFVGPRFSFAPRRDAPVHLIADLELGLGAGVGGILHGGDGPSDQCPQCDERRWTDRVAWGGYQGFGLGAQIHWFSIYMRAHLEESTATNIPTTLWPSLSIGFEANIKRRAAITLGGGYFGYDNTQDHINAWFYQIGVTVFVDAFSRHKAVEPPPPLPPPPPPPPEEDWDEPEPE